MKKAASTMPKCLDFSPLVDGFLLRSSCRAVVSLDLCFRSIGMVIFSEWISDQQCWRQGDQLEHSSDSLGP